MLRRISQDCCCQCPAPVAGHYRPTPLQVTFKHSQESLIQYPVGSLLLSPGSWCAQDLVWALQEFLFPPVLRKLYNQILLAFKVKFPGDSQFLGWIPRLGRLICCLEPSQNCESFFGVIVLQFVSRPPSDCIVELMTTFFKRTYALNRHSRPVLWDNQRGGRWKWGSGWGDTCIPVGDSCQ